MKYIATIILSLMMIGCGQQVEDQIEEGIADVLDKNTTVEVIKPIEKAETKSFAYYGIEMYSQPDSSFNEYSFEDGLYVHEKSDFNWEYIWTLSTKEDGTIKLMLADDNYDDEYGVSAKSKYRNSYESLDDKYTLIEEVSRCYGSDYMCQASNYSYSLYKGERFEFRLYEDKENNTSIVISVNGIGVYDTRVKITYETEKFNNFIDSSFDNL